jgi:CheY-like chemotaxis protein
MAKILLADDDEHLVQATRRLLEAHDHRVTVAVTGTEALELLQKNIFDLVISDHNMPGMTGLELLQWLRKEGNGVPFLLRSGNDGPELPQTCQLYRGVFLYKTMPGLMNTVNRMLAAGSR